MCEALVVLIPKPNKDPFYCESYRLISLINTNFKIISKILASCLNSVITTLINPDQTGFITGQSTHINIHRLFTILQSPNVLDILRVVVTVDTHKALNSVEWPYLLDILDKFGFGPNFLNWIRILYDQPLARIHINGNIYRPFTIHRGTRQGCPLSPLLFALAIKPLVQLLRSSPDVQGMWIGSLEELVSLYDMLLYLSNPQVTISIVLQVITGFGAFSGFKVKGLSLVFSLQTPHSI